MKGVASQSTNYFRSRECRRDRTRIRTRKRETRNKDFFKKQKVDVTRPVVFKHQHRHNFEPLAVKYLPKPPRHCVVRIRERRVTSAKHRGCIARNRDVNFSVENFYNNTRRSQRVQNGFIDREQSNFSWEQLLLSSITQRVMGLHIHKCTRRASKKVICSGGSTYLNTCTNLSKQKEKKKKTESRLLFVQTRN